MLSTLNFIPADHILFCFISFHYWNETIIICVWIPQLLLGLWWNQWITAISTLMVLKPKMLRLCPCTLQVCWFLPLTGPWDSRNFFFSSVFLSFILLMKYSMFIIFVKDINWLHTCWCRNTCFTSKRVKPCVNEHDPASEIHVLKSSSSVEVFTWGYLLGIEQRKLETMACS